MTQVDLYKDDNAYITYQNDGISAIKQKYVNRELGRAWDELDEDFKNDKRDLATNYN